MKNLSTLLILIPFWIACQSSEPSEFGIEPKLAAYNDDAPVLRKTSCMDANCKEIMSEDKYIYDASGKLTRIDNIVRTGKATMDIYSYVEYLYNAAGQLSHTATHSRIYETGWTLTLETDFEYTNDILTFEKTYSHQMSAGTKTLIRSLEYEYKDGKKMGQRYLDGQNKLMYRVEYGYKNNVLNLETWYDSEDKANRTFEHTFSGNRRQIGEYLLSSREVLAMIEKTYDEQGRLSTQTTKVNNPFLCSLAPGLIKYSY